MSLAELIGQPPGGAEDVRRACVHDSCNCVDQHLHLLRGRPRRIARMCIDAHACTPSAHLQAVPKRYEAKYVVSSCYLSKLASFAVCLPTRR